ncbi:MAG: proton-conducting transporter membrane subunit [Deltaproteobacteria bacterium]|nr:proton-conducting transporter membrane subunit [Deltaproteobacteria bacterium]
MNEEIVIWLLLAVPTLAGLASLLAPSPKLALAVMCAGIVGTAGLGLWAVGAVLLHGRVLFAAANWLVMDALSAYHFFVMLVVFGLSSLYGCIYFQQELWYHHLTLKQIRQFTSLWCGALAAMAMTLLSNNLGLMWVGIEATTLVTAFLICIYFSRESLEAMWKYILVCSVGVAFAFMGTLLAAASAKGAGIDGHHVLLWTTLRTHADLLDPALMKAAFIFLLVGYGTKAGLAPMHSWLPDAHSQAPSPVSALFSGILLSTSMYCLMRYIPIVEGATRHTGWGLNLLTGFGLISITLAAGFILFQTHVKRFLAYSSMEHIGIIALGLGLGPLGTLAALLHTLNHALAKTLAFFSAGRLAQMTSSYSMKSLRGVLRLSPLWGTALFAGILALIGMAPFSLFISEFMILKAALQGGSLLVAAVFLAGIGVVFIGALSHLIPMVWGTPADPSLRPARPSFLEYLLVAAPLAVLLLLGLWMPQTLFRVLNAAAGIVSPAGGIVPLSGGWR